MFEPLRYYEVPQFSITPTTVTYFSRLMDVNTGEYFKKSKANELPESNDTKGEISKKSYSRVYKRIFTFIYNVDKEILMSGKGREKVGFITLTLPSSQVKCIKTLKDKRFSYTVFYNDDREIKKKCLNQLFVELDKNYGLKNKLWKAEKQDNGSIHFHILVDRFIPYNDLRSRWNRIVNKLGYVDRYRENMCKVSEDEYVEKRIKETNWNISKEKRKELVKKYRETYKEQKANNWSNPNSVDIHGLYKDNKGKSVKNIVAYIAKYMSKDEQKIPGTDYIKGRIWYCSQLISKSCKVVVEAVDDVLIQAFEKALEKIKDVYVVSDEYFTCGCFNIVQALKIGIKEFDNIFSNNLETQKILMYGTG